MNNYKQNTANRLLGVIPAELGTSLSSEKNSNTSNFIQITHNYTLWMNILILIL